MIGSHIAEAACLQQDDGVSYCYLPPHEWPPKDYDRPPVDDWMPPPYWEPRNQVPLSRWVSGFFLTQRESRDLLYLKLNKRRSTRGLSSECWECGQEPSRRTPTATGRPQCAQPGLTGRSTRWRNGRRVSETYRQH